MGAALAVFAEGLGRVAVRKDGDIPGWPFLHKDIVIETVVTVQESHEPHHFGIVGHMVRRVTGAGPPAYRGEGAADQVVDHGDALAGKAHGSL